MNSLMNLPRCASHDVSMEYVVPRTYEQRFVGTMYRCPYCGNSVLLPSAELTEQLKKMDAASGGHPSKNSRV